MTTEEVAQVVGDVRRMFGGEKCERSSIDRLCGEITRRLPLGWRCVGEICRDPFEAPILILTVTSPDPDTICCSFAV